MTSLPDRLDAKLSLCTHADHPLTGESGSTERVDPAWKSCLQDKLWKNRLHQNLDRTFSESRLCTYRPVSCWRGSFNTQIADCRLGSVYLWPYTDPSTGHERVLFQTATGDFLHKNERNFGAISARNVILSGALPPRQFGRGLPERFNGTRAELLDGTREGEACTVRETIHATVESLDYNGLLPFNKTIRQVLDRQNFTHTRIDSQNEEETGSTCFGMSLVLLKQLRNKHGIEGMFASQRIQGREAICHAAVIIECSDGYLLLDTRSNPENRIFSIPLDEPAVYGKCGERTFEARKHGTFISILESNPEEEYEYFTNIENGDDLVAKHFMMEAPFSGNDPSFPISAYYKDGRGSKAIWVSPSRRRLTFKNMTLAKNDPKRTDIVTFEEAACEGQLFSRLTSLYDNGSPTFQIELETMHQQICTFVKNIDIIDKIFTVSMNLSQ